MKIFFGTELEEWNFKQVIKVESKYRLQSLFEVTKDMLKKLTE